MRGQYYDCRQPEIVRRGKGLPACVFDLAEWGDFCSSGVRIRSS